jgi:acyl-CoA synthetase (AMP-forming)/AMP-acid ligase II
VIELSQAAPRYRRCSGYRGAGREVGGDGQGRQVPAERAAPDEAALIAFTRDRLAHYKCPTSVSIVPALPRNPTGKVLKRQLRSSFIPDPGLARPAAGS